MARTTTTKKPSSSAATPASAIKTARATEPKPKSRIPAPAAKPMVAVVDKDPVSLSPEMKKQELIQKVVDRSEIKKKDAKPVVEAMLEVLGEALADGRELNLQPLGKFKLNRIKETPNARVIVVKIRQSKKSEGAGHGPSVTMTAAE